MPKRFILNFKKYRHTLCGLGAILIWSTSIALARSITEQIGSLTAAAAVHLVGGAFCLGHHFFRGQNSLHQVRRLSPKYLFGCGTLFVLYMLALFLAIGSAADRRQVLEVGLINYLWPALTIIFSLFLLKFKANLLLAPGTLLALLGIFLVLRPDNPTSLTSIFTNIASNPLSYGLAMIAAVSWALYSNLTRRWAGPESSGGVVLFLPAAGIFLFLLRLGSIEESLWNWRAVGEVIFMGLATALGYVLWDIAMRKGNLVFVAAFSYFTPFFSTLLSCIYLGITAGVALWLGCLLIVAGSFLSWAAVSAKGSPTSHHNKF